jgi:hypothetical protein
MGLRPLVCFDNPGTTTQQFSLATIRPHPRKHKPPAVGFNTQIKGCGEVKSKNHPAGAAHICARTQFLFETDF